MPKKVKVFEYLMYVTILIDVPTTVLQQVNPPISASKVMTFYIVPIVLNLFVGLLVWLVAHRRQNWARWVLFLFIGGPLIVSVVLTPLILLGAGGEGLIFALALLLRGNALETLAVFLIPILQIVAFCFVFSPSSNAWFKKTQELS